MRPADIFRLSLRPWRQKKVRVGLLMLAIAIGVSSIIALVSQTAGAQQAVTKQLQALGPTSIVITPIGRTQLTDSDVGLISSLPNVETVIPMISTRVFLNRAGQDVEVSLIGVDPLRLPLLLGELRLVEGTIYNQGPAPLAVVGYELAFPSSLGYSKQIYTAQPVLVEQRFQSFSRRIPIVVSGILSQYGASAFVSIDNAFFISLEAAQALTNQRNYNLILVRADSVENVQSVVDQLTAVYGERARILALQTLSSTIAGVIGQFSLLLGSVAGISLTVAGLGIMNIMLVSVIERTREIGVMKAVGFKDGEVLSVFLFEALMVGVFGGLLGIVLGVFAAYGLPVLLGGSLFFGQGFRPPGGGGFGPPGFGGQTATITITPVIPLDTLTVAYGFAILVCMLAGVYPAWRAARLDPIKAIRYE